VSTTCGLVKALPKPGLNIMVSFDLDLTPTDGQWSGAFNQTVIDDIVACDDAGCECFEKCVKSTEECVAECRADLIKSTFTPAGAATYTSAGGLVFAGDIKVTSTNGSATFHSDKLVITSNGSRAHLFGGAVIKGLPLGICEGETATISALGTEVLSVPGP